MVCYCKSVKEVSYEVKEARKRKLPRLKNWLHKWSIGQRINKIEQGAWLPSLRRFER
jgi:hypothetical protein